MGSHEEKLWKVLGAVNLPTCFSKNWTQIPTKNWCCCKGLKMVVAPNGNFIKGFLSVCCTLHEVDCGIKVGRYLFFRNIPTFTFVQFKMTSWQVRSSELTRATLFVLLVDEKNNLSGS